jgi:hypothetical protein
VLAGGGWAGYGVLARVHRLMEPASRVQRARNQIALVALILLIAVGFVLLTQLSDTLAMHASALPT